MKVQKLYAIAKKRHGQLAMDAVHDMYVKMGSDLPSDAYVTVCLKHHKPEPIQKTIEIEEQYGEDFDLYGSIEKELSKAINNVRDKYELEVDTFLECRVHSSVKDFERRSGISRSVIEKICNFAQHEILKEFRRISPDSM